MNERPPDTGWKSWQIILFKFFVIFLLLLSQVAYNPFLNLLGYGYRKSMQLNARLTKLVSWLDDHIFHVGFLPGKHVAVFNDTHFGVVLLLTIFVIAIIGCSIWSILDKKRINYDRFYHWFSTYLAFYIFLAMIPYAVQKIIPIQAHYPTAPELLTRWGDLRNWEVLFRFMGTSPAYCMFSGWLELIASVLILFHRPRVLGGLLMTIVLVQVVLFNIFYNNNIIMLSGTLLLSTLFITARSLPKLFSILIRLKPVSLVQYRYKFITPWKKSVIIAIFFLPLWKVYKVTTRSWTFYKGVVRNQEKQKLYNVISYQQGNDTLPPLTTDSLRWRYVCFLDYAPNNQQMVKFDMQENQETHAVQWDTLHKKIFLSGEKALQFSYVYFPNGNLALAGNWQGRNIKVQLAKMSIDTLNLVKDKFLFMQEDQD
jgi:hypothetical protein